MVRKKCPHCEKKVEGKFNFCPHCGSSIKSQAKGNDFGMLGRTDSAHKVQNEIKLPLGMEKMMGSLIKQLEKQMGNVNFDNVQGMPKNIKIQIARKPQGANVGQPVKEKPKVIEDFLKVSEKEMKRRMSLLKVDAESKVRRLADTITYEIETPGVKKKEDVVLTELATGLEMKAYSRDKCYVKFIPLKIEVVEYYVEKEKVFIELKS